MEINNFHEKTIPQPQLSSFSPMVPVSVCYDSTLLPAPGNYPIPEYNRGVNHRELLKDRIRQDMYAEMALKEELRREILMENEFLMPKMMLPDHSYDRGFNEGTFSRSSRFVDNGVIETMQFQRDPMVPHVGSSRFVDNGVIETMPFQRDPKPMVPKVGSSRFVDNEVIETMPFQRHPKAMVPKVESSVSQSAREGLLLLPKKSNVSGHQVRIGFANPEQAQTTRVKESAIAGSSKTEKRDLRCFLCHITATSAQALDDHIRGKKHKAKAKRLKGKHIANKKRGNNNKNQKTRK